MGNAKSRINFFTLSAELRNQIYEIALDLDKEIGLPIQSQCKHDTWSYPIPVLLAANKQIRAEASPIFLGNKKLCLPARHEKDVLPALIGADDLTADVPGDPVDA